jgi:CheY-like chemotaxis protein
LARKILLADDSVTAQNMGRKILADAGYEVATVNNGSAALKRIAEHKPDLIVLDVYMPGYSGLEVCQRLKESTETSRIPVLLTVGKLEPFKPEEAQRVRAEGFIVKPFEASELLSALSRLEDKVVPRPEPSKPGRFARAMAAVEESNRNGDDTSWKERLAIPGRKKKTEAEPKVADDDPAIYNPVNRDLRTLVEKPAQPEAKPQEAAEAKPAGGLPEDVTPEELAAIAAAMAQMQGSWADAKTAEQLVARALSANAADRAAEQAAAGESATKVETPAPAEAKAEVAGEARIESLPPAVAPPTEVIASDSVARNTAIAEAEEKIDSVTEEIPATMAAAAAAAASASSREPRWMAVPVTLAAEEVSISLEREMQAAYAAFASAEANQPGFVAPTEPEPAVIQTSLSAKAVAEPAVTVSPAAEPEPVMSTNATEPAPVAIAPPSPEATGEPAVVSSADPAIPEESLPASFSVNVGELPRVHEPVEAPAMHSELPRPEAVEAQPTKVSAPTFEPPAEQAQEREKEPSVSNFAAAIAETPVASPISEEAAYVLQPEREVAQAPPDHDAPPAWPENEASVATTAAAWASWRQIRDAGDTKDSIPNRPVRESEALPAAAQAESAAMAVAAGAEKIVQEASAASPNADPSAIASIVESVLADLRPKIVEEISRKLAGEKK